MGTLAPRQKKKRNRALLPVMGLTLAVLLALVAYGSAVWLVQFGEDHNDLLKAELDGIRDQLAKYGWYRDTEPYHQNRGVEILAAALLWLIMLALCMFAVSLMVVGTDPEREAAKAIGPSPANKGEVIKQLKKDLKKARQQEREMKRRAKK